MKRRNFITGTLLALPALSIVTAFGFKKKESKEERPAKKGFVVRANESRYDGKQSQPKDAFLHCKISTVDTNGDLFIQTSTPEVFRMAGGPPPHVHGFEDEIIYIVSGEFIVHIDGEDFPVKTGDTAFIPRGTMHTVINPIEHNPGMLITLFQPAPKKVEDFFHYISRHGAVPTDIVPEGW